VDVARYGADRSVIYLRRGPVIRLHSEHSKLPTTETTGRVIAAKRETQADEIRVDGVGIGAGVVDQLTEQGYPVLDMQAGARATEPDRFVNQRAEWAWNLRDLLESGDADLDPADDELAAQLGALKFRYDSRGRIAVESKDEARKRGLPSPDHADAAILTAVAPVGSDLFRALGWRYWRPAVTGIAGQVDCGGRISTLTEGWVYGSVHLPSGEDAATDWAVAAVWCQTIHGDLLLLDLARRRLGAELIGPLVRTYRPDTVFVAKKQLTDTVRAQAGRERIPVTPLDVAEADLFTRALVASSAVVAGRVWLPAGAGWASQWVAECGAYPHTRAHGCVAALALATHVQTTKWQPPPRTSAARANQYDDGPDFMTIAL
jgi:phage terminase large subunit-like protein